MHHLNKLLLLEGYQRKQKETRLYLRPALRPILSAGMLC